MVNIAIVEDEDAAADLLSRYLNKYQRENGESFQITRFEDAETFLRNYREGFDIALMDVKMPNMDGISAAARLREFDNQVVLIFITSMTQFAIKGYEVDALNYIVKPVAYEKLAFVLSKAVSIVKANEKVEFTVPQGNGVIRLSSKDIYYIEVRGHRLYYHLGKKVVEGYGSLSDLDANLKGRSFMRCNNCYLVNPKHIESVRGYDVVMRNGDILKISQPRKKKFMNDLTDWLGRGNIN